MIYENESDKVLFPENEKQDETYTGYDAIMQISQVFGYEMIYYVERISHITLI